MITNYNYIVKVLKRVLSLAFTLFIIYIALRLSVFYLPFLIALVLALLLEPIIRWLMKKLKWTRIVSSIVIIGITLLILLAIIGWGSSTLFKEANNLLEGKSTYFDKTKNMVNSFTNNKAFVDGMPDELKKNLENIENDWINSLVNWLTNTLENLKTWIKRVPNLLMTFFFTLMALFFMCTDKIFIIDQLEHHLPEKWMKKLTTHLHQFISSFSNYLKAEITLIFISFVISLVGLVIFKLCKLNVPYPLITALGIAFVDALPIIGSGAVMVPWAVIEAINGDILLGFLIIVLWSIMGVVRNLLEPKMVSKHIGIHPIFTLIAMYTGFKIIGVMGMILGPIVLLILKEIYSPMIDQGIFKSIFE